MLISTFWGSLTLLLVSYLSVFTASNALNVNNNVDLAQMARLASRTRLVLTLPKEAGVRGLAVGVPTFDEGAKRLTFAGQGQSVEYKLAATHPLDVAYFYASELPRYGWKQIDDEDFVFVNQKENTAVRISTATLPYDGIHVRYEVASIPQHIGMVLGEQVEKVSFWSQLLAQADTSMPPPPPSGSIGSMPPPPTGSFDGNTQMMPPPGGTMMPPPDGTMMPPPGGTQTMFPPGFAGEGTDPLHDPRNFQNPLGPSGQFKNPQGQFGPPAGGQGNFNNSRQPFGSQQQPSNNFGPRQFEGQQNGFDQRQFGEHMSEEDSERRSQEQQEQQLKQMKSQIGGFLGQASRMQKEMTSVEKRLKKMCPDMSLPTELKNALASVNTLADQIKNAESVEGVQEAMFATQDAGMAMQEWGQQIPDLFKLCMGRKQMKNDLKQIESRFKKLQSRIIRLKNKDDFAQIVTDAQTAVADLKSESDKANSLTTTDPEAAIEAFEAFFEKRNDVEEELQALDTVLNMAQGIKIAKQEIKKYESTIKRLGKKYDTAELTSLIALAKEKLAELEAAIRAKEDPETLATLVDELFDLKRQFENTLAELTGQEEFTPQGKTNEKAFNFELNNVFRRSPEGQQNEFGDGPGMGQGSFSGPPQF